MTVPFGFVLAALGALFAFFFALVERPFVNLYWQIADGVAISQTHHLPARIASAIESGPVVAHEWLFELAAGLLASHGLYAVLVLLCALAAAATPLLVYALARVQGTSALAAGIAGCITVGSRFVGSSLRPETFAVDFFALELLVLARALPIWSAFPIAVLWANIHASAVLAVAIPAVVAIAATLAKCDQAQARRAAAVTVLSAVATLVTPYGVLLWQYAWGHGVTADPSTAVIATWEPLTFSSQGAWTAVLPGVLLFMLCGVLVRRALLPELTIAVMFGAATVLHERYAVFLAVAWALPLARSIDTRTLVQRFEDRPRPSALLALTPIAIAALVLLTRVQRAPLAEGRMATAASIAADRHLSGNAYVDIVWAGYLTYRRLPLHVLADGHGDMSYPPSVWSDTAALQRLTPQWRAVLDRRQIQVVIVDESAAIASGLATQANWRLAERRSGVVAYIRR